MTQLRFDDRVAVVTGAGGGLGEAYALLLASRGARVVVNDIGANLKGSGADARAAAQAVVDKIHAAGGEAIASTDSVATPAGGKAIIEAALDHFGRLDILIHNAGIVRGAPLKEMTQDDFDAVIDVHLRGGFHVLRPAFPIMCKAGYGRIVLTASANGLYGASKQANYSAAKGGLIALSHVAAVEGAAEGVKSNVILPGAITRMSEGIDTSKFPPMPPELVAPVVGWLAHESCSVTGELLVSVAGRVARAFTSESPGIARKDWTIESVAQQLPAIRDAHAPIVFPVVPAGRDQHLGYSFKRSTEG